MRKNLFKTALTVFTIISFTVLITTSCIIINPPQETKALETVTTGTASSTNESETTSTGAVSTETNAQDSTTATTSADTTSATTTTIRDTKLTQQEAIDIAFTVAQGSVERIETEIEHGKLVWKVRILSGDTRTDVRIDDATGDIVEIKTSDD